MADSQQAVRFETVRTLARALRNKDHPPAYEVLLAAAGNKDPAVRITLLSAPKDCVSANALKLVSYMIARDALNAGGDNLLLRAAIAQSLWVPEQSLRAVHNEHDWLVCIGLVNNPNCPEDTLIALSRLPHVDLHLPNGATLDKNKEVREIAKKRLLAQRRLQ